MVKLSDAHIALGDAVRALRARDDISQEELAFRSGLHRTYVGHIERGEKNLCLTNLRRLAAAFELDASELLARGEALEP